MIYGYDMTTPYTSNKFVFVQVPKQPAKDAVNTKTGKTRSQWLAIAKQAHLDAAAADRRVDTSAINVAVLEARGAEAMAETEVNCYEASLTNALGWAGTAVAGEYLVEYADTGMTDVEDPGSSCGYSDPELAEIEEALGRRDLRLVADDRGLGAQAVRS